MEQSAASSTAPLFPDIATLLQQVSAAQANPDQVLAPRSVGPTTAGTPPPVPTQQPYAQQASPFTAQPSPADLRHDMETQLQRALVSMRALSALTANSQQPTTTPLFSAQQAHQPLQQLVPETGTTSQSAVSAGDTDAATAFHAVGAPSIDTLQWLQAALARTSAGIGGVHPLAALTASAAAQQAESGETTDMHRGGAGMGSTTNTVMAMAAREALAQVYAAGASSGAKERKAASGSRGGKSRKADAGGLQLCKVCETRKLPQHFYNRHKTCKNCQCQINRIARSQHCSRDEAKRQVNAAAHAGRGGSPQSPSANPEGLDGIVPAGPLHNAVRLGSCNFGGSVTTSGRSPSPSPRGAAPAFPLSRVASAPLNADPTAPGKRSRSPDWPSMLNEPGPMAPANRASRTGFTCGIDHLADIASAILDANNQGAKARRAS